MQAALRRSISRCSAFRPAAHPHAFPGTLPDDAGPFLEILEYDTTEDASHRAPNAQGFGHLAFEVSDIHSTIADIIAHGGSRQGEVVNFGTDTAPLLIIYMRDPEGNILELEQP